MLAAALHERTYGMADNRTTVLFIGVPWSKFAHMFYKPAAAYQRRVEEASGASGLPQPASGQHQVR